MKTVYSTKGRILQVVSCPDISLPSILEREEVAGIIDGNFNDLIYYIVDGLAVHRPVMQIVLATNTIIANSIDSVNITNLPDPCRVTYTGPGFKLTDEVTGGTATFTTDSPGKHTIKVVAFPYLDWEGTFDAV